MSLLLWEVMAYLGIKTGCIYQMWMISGQRFLQRPMVLDIQYIQVPPRCIMILKDLLVGSHEEGHQKFCVQVS